MTHSTATPLAHSITLMMDTLDRIGDAAQEGYGYFAQRATRLLLADTSPSATYQELHAIFCAEVEEHLDRVQFFSKDTEQRIRKDYSTIKNAPTLQHMLPFVA